MSHENCEATAISAKCTERWFGPTIDALWLAGYSRTVMVAVEDGVVTGITVDWSGTYPERAGDPDEEVLEWVGGFDADAEKVMADVVFEVPPSAEAAELWVEYTTRWVEAGRP